MGSIPGLAAMRNITPDSAPSTPQSHLESFIPDTPNIIISIARRRKTEPRYATLFAHSAISRLVDTERSVYPIFTTSTEEKSVMNQPLSLRTKTMQATSSKSDSIAAAKYIAARLAFLAPTGAQPERHNIKDRAEGTQ